MTAAGLGPAEGDDDRLTIRGEVLWQGLGDLQRAVSHADARPGPQREHSRFRVRSRPFAADGWTSHG